MMPWGHLAVGYLAYSVGTRVWSGRTPAGGPTILLAMGTQFPDLVDKPLNWWFGIFDGRAIGHSVLVMGMLCTAILVVAYRRERGALGAAFSVGVVTHLLGDSWQALLHGDFGSATFLLWPLFPAPTYPKDSLIDHLVAMRRQFSVLSDLSAEALLASQAGQQLVLLVVLVGLWAVDGFPGVRTMWTGVVGDRRNESS